MASINYFSEDIKFTLPHPRKTSAWIKAAIIKERKSLTSLNYVFCSDSFLLTLNKSYLNHTTLTDIITFDYSADPKKIEGEIYVSIERVKENSSKFLVPFEQELHRVLIHGVLHLAGYSDKKTKEKALMRNREEAYLSLRS